MSRLLIFVLISPQASLELPQIKNSYETAFIPLLVALVWDKLDLNIFNIV